MLLRFQGIPFAEPPVGARRFQDPELIHPWEGVKDCSGGPPSMCPQVANVNDPLYSDKQHLYFQLDFFNPDPANPGKISGSEDCLFLNIYTRNLPSADMTSTTPLRWVKTFCFDSFATVWSCFLFVFATVWSCFYLFFFATVRSCSTFMAVALPWVLVPGFLVRFQI